MLDAIILAGTEKPRTGTGLENKALLRIHGRYMIEYVIDALERSGYVDKIIVAGSMEPLRTLLQPGISVVESGEGTILENLKKGICCLNPEKKLLICTCDIPFITAEAIGDFIIRSVKSQADVCYPIVDKKVNDVKFPGIRRTYVKLRDGTFTGGNIFYMNPRVLDRGLQLAEKLLEARKKPLTLAGIFGIGFLAQFITGKLTVEKAENKFSALFNIRGKAIQSQYPEIGNDIDKPEDVAYAERYFAASTQK